MTERKVFRIYRNDTGYYGDERWINFDTIPFLKGVGCGSISLENVVASARIAIKKGYRIILFDCQVDNCYPLHLEDYKSISEQLGLNQKF